MIKENECFPLCIVAREGSQSKKVLKCLLKIIPTGHPHCPRRFLPFPRHAVILPEWSVVKSKMAASLVVFCKVTPKGQKVLGFIFRSLSHPEEAETSLTVASSRKCSTRYHKPWPPSVWLTEVSHNNQSNRLSPLALSTSTNAL